MDYDYCSVYFDQWCSKKDFQYIKKIIDGQTIDKNTSLFNKITFDRFTQNITDIIAQGGLWSDYRKSVELIYDHFLSYDEIFIEQKNITIGFGLFPTAHKLVKRLIDQRSKIDTSILNKCISMSRSLHPWDLIPLEATVKLLIDNGDKPTIGVLENMCLNATEAIIEYTLQTGVKPTKQCFINLLENYTTINLNILFEYDFKFKDGAELFEIWEKHPSYHINEFKKLDIMKAVEKIDNECLLKCYQHGITVIPSLLENNVASVDHLRAACKGDSIMLPKQLAKQYGLKFDEVCLENACATGYRGMIDFLVQKCGIRVTEKCILLYARRGGSNYIKKLFANMDGEPKVVLK